MLAARSDEAAIRVVMDNAADTPFVPAEMKDVLSELLFARRWDALKEFLGCQDAMVPDASTVRANDFHHFRDMIVAIFTDSRKVASLPSERRRALGAAIHASRSKSKLRMLALQSLETSIVFNGGERELVANDILDERYDLLLRPNRFDCEEGERAAIDTLTVQTADYDGCPVCLGENRVDTCLPCNHRLCHGCASGWLLDQPTCPMCRAPARLEQCRGLRP